MQTQAELLDKMLVLQDCLDCVSNLLIPDAAMDIDRDKLARLLMYVAEDQRNTLKKLISLN